MCAAFVQPFCSAHCSANKSLKQHCFNVFCIVRVCNLYQERVTSIKTVLFLIVASVILLPGETVLTKWQSCQNEIMTTTAVTIKNQEKTTQNKLKVLQLTNENTNKIGHGINLLKSIQRHCKLMESKVEECNEI